jgi:hypothetical protein
MSDITFGEIDWNSATTTEKTKNIYMSLKEGDNIIRVLSNPVQYYVHWVETDAGKRKITSPIESPELVTKLEDAGFRRQTRWILRVIDRNTDEPKLLEVGTQILNGIISIRNNPKWGDLRAYDISVNRGKPGQTPLYRVNPEPKEALSAELKKSFSDFLAETDIEQVIKPTSVEKVCEIMGWNSSRFVSDVEEDSDDFDFGF